MNKRVKSLRFLALAAQFRRLAAREACSVRRYGVAGEKPDDYFRRVADYRRLEARNIARAYLRLARTCREV